MERNRETGNAMKRITVGELHDNLDKYLDEVRNLSGIIVMRNLHEDEAAVILPLNQYRNFGSGDASA